MKHLPYGIQEFSEIISQDYLYVDKTELIFKVLHGKYYFLSRPRRFGKSLLLNTIKEIFNGNRELFKGLWIYDKIKWEIHPVIKISFSNIDYLNIGLLPAIENEINLIARENNIALTENGMGSRFRELIIKISHKKGAIILIDEYDKPIIDYLDDLDQANENRKILKSFYAVIKDADRYIRFFFVTGVSKFSKVSIFSDLNNLDDITLDRNYATLTGWTLEEVLDYFPENIEQVKNNNPHYAEDIVAAIKEWYDGYSWDGENYVFNPVSLMNLFNKQVFNNYWFSTGTPTFLMEIIRKERFTPQDIEKRWMSVFLLDKYDLKNMSFLPLLFQTGYLTIKQWDHRRQRILLDYPNKEVAESFTTYILSELTIGQLDTTGVLLIQMVDAFLDFEIEKFITHFNTLLKNIPYSIIDNKEKYFHSIFYMVMKLTGFTIESEILTIDGRIDAVLKTDDHIYIIEFKIDHSAEKAIQQIRDKGYAEKYADDTRPKILLGINFNSDTRKVDEYKLIEV